MGNISEKEDNVNSDIEDGEIVYDTLARDIAYLRCISEDNKPVVSRSESVRKNRRNPPRRSVSRKRSFKRSVSSKKGVREPKANVFLLSDLEVQVDGKRALLVPRKSVVQRKGLAALKAKMNFISNRKSTKKIKMAKSIKAKSVEHLPSSGLSVGKKQANKVTLNVAGGKNNENAKAPLAQTKSHHMGVSSTMNESKLRAVSVHGNININVNRTGNMALNMEKAKLRKLASMEAV